MTHVSTIAEPNAIAASFQTLLFILIGLSYQPGLQQVICPNYTCGGDEMKYPDGTSGTLRFFGNKG